MSDQKQKEQVNLTVNDLISSMCTSNGVTRPQALNPKQSIATFMMQTFWEAKLRYGRMEVVMPGTLTLETLDSNPSPRTSLKSPKEHISLDACGCSSKSSAPLVYLWCSMLVWELSDISMILYVIYC